MKKLIIILACMLVCLSLLSGCVDDKDKDNSSSDIGNSVEVDIDTEAKGDTEISSGDGDIVYDFKDPENTDGIVVAPKE